MPASPAFPEAPYVATLRALQAHQSRKQIHFVQVLPTRQDAPGFGVSIERKGAKPTFYSRFREPGLFTGFAPWADAFQGVLRHARLLQFSVEFAEAPRATTRRLPDPDPAVLAIVRAATRRLELQALSLAFAQDGPAQDRVVIGCDANRCLKSPKPRLSLRLEAERASGEALVVKDSPEVGRWWDAIQAWRIGVARLAFSAEFEAQSAHDLARVLAAAAVERTAAQAA